MNRKALGRAAEEAARRYLEKNGYRVLATNYKTRYGELDLIVESPQGKVTVFVEVRSRSGDGMVDPSETLGKRKVDHLIKTAKIYLTAEGRLTNPFRFDFIGIRNDPGGWEIDHRIGVFNQEELDYDFF